MALRLITDFVNTNIPGVYPRQQVKSVPVGLSTSGVIALLGEAEGGAFFKDEDLKENFFGPDALDRVETKYIAGNLVESMRLLSAPSSDTRITGSANSVGFLKTNSGSKSELAIGSPSNYGKHLSRNFGVSQNKYAAELDTVQDEVAPSFTGTDIDFLNAANLNDAEFKLREQGGAEVTVTLSSTTTDHDDMTKLLAEISPQLPAGISASNDGDKLVLSMASGANPEFRGYGLVFEIYGDAPDLLVLGLQATPVASGAEVVKELNVTNVDTNLNEFFEVGGAIYLELGHLGGSVTAEITAAGKLVTVGAPTNLDITLSEVTTLGDLVDLINSTAAEYSAFVEPALSSRPPTILDVVGPIGISSGVANVRHGRFKADAWDYARRSNESTETEFEAGTGGTKGLPADVTKTFFSGGSKGGTIAADIVDAFEALEGLDVNFVVPLFSRDASDDIVDGLTDSASTYTIDAIHALAKTHVLEMSTVKRKKNRQFIASFDGDYVTAKAKAGTIGNARGALTMQRVSQVNGVGVTNEFQPWAQAVVAAGMQTAGFYKSIVKKFANVISFKDPVGFDSGSPSQVEDALDAGIVFMEKFGQQSRWVSDQTTYSFDANFVFNSIQAVYGADLVALSLAQNIDNRFTGESLADIDIATVLGFITKNMDDLKRVKLITGSKDAPLGFKNVKVSISGPVMRIKIEVKLTTSVYFIPLEIEYSQVQLEGEL